MSDVSRHVPRDWLLRQPVQSGFAFTNAAVAAGRCREDIFRGNGDREMLLATLAGTVGKAGWLVHAWVWMSNHYHLLVETPEANLVKVSDDRHHPLHCAAPSVSGRFSVLGVQH